MSVTLDGETFTLARFQNLGHATIVDAMDDRPAEVLFPDRVFSRFLADAGKALKTTSSTSATIASTGTVAMTLHNDRPFTPGGTVYIIDRNAASNWVFGRVEGYNSSTIIASVSVITANGSIGATKADWDFIIGGERGASGAPGSLSGNATGAIDMNSNQITLDDVVLETGIRAKCTDHGSLSSSTTTIAWNATEYHKMEIGAAVVIDFTAPTSGYFATKTLFVHHDGTGGRVPTFKRAGGTTNIKWITDEPAWSGHAASTVVRVVAQYDNEDGYLYLHGNEDIRA